MIDFRQLYDNDYFRVEFDRPSRVMVRTCKPAMITAEIEAFKLSSLEMARLVEKLKVVALVDDANDCDYAVRTELGEWTVSRLAAALQESGVKKYVYSVDCSALEAYPRQQAVEAWLETFPEEVQAMYFTTRAEALEWLLF